MNTKFIAIIAVAVIVVAGAGTAVFLLNKDSGDDKVETTDRLMILGNADNDDDIDDNDVSTLEDIIDEGTWDKEKYPYADADNSGTIDSADVEIVKGIIDKSATSVKYVNVNGDIKDAHYPINKFVTVGTYAANAAVELGLCDKVVGISGSKSWSNSDFWVGIKDKTKISSSSITADIGLVSNIEGVQAVVVTASGVDNEADFEAANINVIRLDFSGPNQIGALLMLGFLADNTDRSEAVADFFDEVYEKVDELSEKYADKHYTAAVIYGEAWIYSNAGSHGSIADSAGISNVWIYDSSVDSKNYYKVSAGTEWIKNEEWKNATFIIGQEKWLYADGVDVAAVWDAYESYYSSLNAFDEKTCLVNESMPLPVQLAYIIEFMYPDDVDEGYGAKMHQRFIDDFVDDLSGNYDVTKKGSFFYTAGES